MSWSDDMRCLFCDGKLPLYRKITSGQFCSASHRKLYWQEQEKLAVERLHQTHDSLRAYRPPQELESPLGKASPSEPIFAGGFREAGQFTSHTPQPVPEADLEPGVEEMARSASNTGKVKFAGWVLESRPAPHAGDQQLLMGVAEFTSWTGNDLAAQAMMWLPFAAVPATPEFEPEFLRDLPAASSPELIEAAPVAVEPPAEPAAQTAPVIQPELIAQPAPAAPQAPAAKVYEPEFPLAESLSLAHGGSNAGDLSPKIAAQQPIAAQPSPHTRIADSLGHAATTAIAAIAGLLPLPLGNTLKNHGSSLRAQGGSQAAALDPAIGAPQLIAAATALVPAHGFAPSSRYSMSNGTGQPSQAKAASADFLHSLDPRFDAASLRLNLGTGELRPGLSLAPGCRYAVSIRPGKIGTAAIQSVGVSPAEVTPEDAKAKIHIVALPQDLGAAVRVPAAPRLLPLAFHATPQVAATAQPMATGVRNEYPANQPLLPVEKWEPIEGELVASRKLNFLTSWSQTFAEAGQGKQVWSQVADFWQHAPWDLKLLAIAIPILLGLALRPSLPKVSVKTPVAGTAIQGDLERGFRVRLANFRQTLAERAAVALNEDFRQGLEDWQSRGEPSTGWSFDSNGFVRPGTLALYRPSVGLTDYEMQFLGLIDKKALSWVVRAADFDNYYVVKLVVLQPGPLPTIGITRYAVVNGKAQNRVDTVAAINARTDMLYRVTVDVRDDTYLLTLQDKVVDSWSEPRLRKGGVGFFAPHGEESRIRWVQLTHQYDMLGRLCAYLAPYNISTTNGSW